VEVEAIQTLFQLKTKITPQAAPQTATQEEPTTERKPADGKDSASEEEPNEEDEETLGDQSDNFVANDSEYSESEASDYDEAPTKKSQKKKSAKDSNRKERKGWSAADDAKLRMINKKHFRSWRFIAKFMKRSISACRTRYRDLLVFAYQVDVRYLALKAKVKGACGLPRKTKPYNGLLRSITTTGMLLQME
jgi:hypothetical protein